MADEQNDYEPGKTEAADDEAKVNLLAKEIIAAVGAEMQVFGNAPHPDIDEAQAREAVDRLWHVVADRLKDHGITVPSRDQRSGSDLGTRVQVQVFMQALINSIQADSEFHKAHPEVVDESRLPPPTVNPTQFASLTKEVMAAVGPEIMAFQKALIAEPDFHKAHPEIDESRSSPQSKEAADKLMDAVASTLKEHDVSAPTSNSWEPGSALGVQIELEVFKTAVRELGK